MPLVPLKEHEKIAQIFSIEEVVLTPDADLDIVTDLEDFVLVAQTEHFLVFWSFFGKEILKAKS